MPVIYDVVNCRASATDIQTREILRRTLIATFSVTFLSDKVREISLCFFVFPCGQQELEIASLTRRIRLVDDDFEQTTTRLQAASEKLEEVSKLAEETERYIQGGQKK